MKEQYLTLDDMEERRIVRPRVLMILLVTAGLTLRTFDGKLDSGPPNNETVIVAGALAFLHQAYAQGGLQSSRQG